MQYLLLLFNWICKQVWGDGNINFTPLQPNLFGCLEYPDEP